MAGSLNRVELIGNLGKDPEIRSTNNGARLATLSIATSESWRDRNNGERKERTEWHRVVIWPEQLVDLVDKFVRKGDKLWIEGQLETRKWSDQSGVERYSTEIVVRRFNGRIILLGGNGGARGGEDRGGGAPQGRLADREPSDAQETRPPRGRNQDLDDEIPFVTSSLLVEPGIARKRDVL